MRDDGGAVLLDLTPANGGLVLGILDDGTGTYWSGYLYATAATTRSLVSVGDAVYDFAMIHAGGDTDTVFRGDVYVIPEVTQP